MSSKQLNFYAVPEDLYNFETFFKENSAKFIKLPVADSNNLFVDSIISLDDSSEWTKIYLTKDEFKEDIILKFIERQNYFLIDDMRSPVVEFVRPIKQYKSNIVERSRFYYKKRYYSLDGSQLQKDLSFTKWADELISNFSKTFLVKITNVSVDKCSRRILEYINAGRIKNGLPFNSRFYLE